MLNKLHCPTLLSSAVHVLTCASLMVNVGSWWLGYSLGFHFEVTCLPPGLNWALPIFNTHLAVVTLITYLLLIGLILPYLAPVRFLTKLIWWLARFTTGAAVVGALWFGWWTHVLQVDYVDHLVYRPGWLVISVVWSPLNHAVYFFDNVNLALVHLVTEEGYPIALASYQITMDTAIGLVGPCPTTLAATGEAANLYVQEAIAQVLDKEKPEIGTPNPTAWRQYLILTLRIALGLLVCFGPGLYSDYSKGGGGGGGDSGGSTTVGQNEQLFLKDLKDMGVDLKDLKLIGVNIF